jgi:hypothetical protein
MPEYSFGGGGGGGVLKVKIEENALTNHWS